MAFTASHNLAGWSFMVASVMLIAPIWLAPATLMALRDARIRTGYGWLKALKECSEPRMMAGFIVVCLGVAINQGGAFPYHLHTASGDPVAAAEYVKTAWPFIAISASFLIVLGSSMVMWDAYAKRPGRFACIVLILAALALYAAGVALTGALLPFIA